MVCICFHFLSDRFYSMANLNGFSILAAIINFRRVFLFVCGLLTEFVTNINIFLTVNCVFHYKCLPYSYVIHIFLLISSLTEELSICIQDYLMCVVNNALSKTMSKIFGPLLSYWRDPQNFHEFKFNNKYYNLIF